MTIRNFNQSLIKYMSFLRMQESSAFKIQGHLPDGSQGSQEPGMTGDNYLFMVIITDIYLI